MPQPPEPRRGRGPQLDHVPQKGRTHGASGAPSDEDEDWDRNRDGIVTGSQKALPKADQVAHLIAQEWGLPFFSRNCGILWRVTSVPPCISYKVTPSEVNQVMNDP